MRQIRQRQLQHGLFWGVAAFAVGWLAVHLILPATVLGSGAQRWQETAWVYLNLNNVPVSGSAVSEVFLLGFVTIDLLQQHPEWVYLRTVPWSSAVVAGALANVSIGRTRRLKHIATNSAVVALGYVAAGLGLVIVSGARPGVSTFLGLVIILGLALAVGSRVVGGVVGGIPILAIASIGTLLIIGLVIVIGGIFLLQLLLPLAVISVIGGEVGGIMVLIARRLP